MKKGALLLSAAIVLLASTALSAQQPTGNATVTDQDIQLMRRDLQSDKKMIIAANMQLTETEAQKFWPVYDQYAAELAKINDGKVAVIKDYAANIQTLTDAKAADLIKRWTEADQDAVQLRLKYLPLLEKVVPGTQAARFFQIDRRIGLLVDLQMASEIPLVEK